MITGKRVYAHNGGDPGGFIIYNHNVDAYELDRRQQLADETFTGANQSRYKILEGDARFVPNTVTPSDMQYEVLLTWVRDSILSGIGVPPPVVGIYDSATYNNVETAHREMWAGPNGILALSRQTEDPITCDLIPRLAGVRDTRMAGGGGGRMELYAHFDSSQIEALQDDVGEKLDRAADIAAKGVGVSFNEALGMQGVEAEQPEEGDRKWGAATLVDLEDPEAGKREMPAPAPTDGGADDGDPPFPAHDLSFRAAMSGVAERTSAFWARLRR